MTSKKLEHNEDPNPKDLVFILAVAGRLDAMQRLIDPLCNLSLRLAEKLDKSRQIYYLYALLDGINLSFSQFNLILDLFVSSSNEVQHDALVSPFGIAGIAIQTIFIASLSILAYHFDDEEKENFKKLIKDGMPFIRDVLKVLRNTHKGIKAFLNVASLLGGTNFIPLLIPFTLVFSVFTAFNRIWLRSMLEARKKSMKKNASLFKEIIELESLSEAQFNSYKDDIRYQSGFVRTSALAGALFAALFDGMYYYLGLLTLGTLMPVLLIPMAVLCGLYVISAIMARTFEEYDYQRQLVNTRLLCEIALIRKRLDLLPSQTDPELQRLLLEEYHDKKKRLVHNCNQSYKSAFFRGLKNGLAAYGALCSIVILTGTLLMLASVSFPPALVAVSISLGVVLLGAFIVQALIKQWIFNAKQLALTPKHSEQEIFAVMQGQNKETTAVGVGVSVSSFFSGSRKGYKAINTSCGFLQEVGADGHYHDVPVTLVLSLVSAGLFGVVYALRAFVKAFGKSAIIADANTSINLQTSEEHIPEPWQKPKALSSSQSVANLSVFRERPNHTQLPHSESVRVLRDSGTDKPSHPVNSHIILG